MEKNQVITFSLTDSLINLTKLNFSYLINPNHQDPKDLNFQRYAQYLVCAKYLDDAGLAALTLTANQLAQVCQIKPYSIQFKMTYEIPSAEIWRSFLADPIIKDWKVTRIIEALDSTSNKIMVSAVISGEIESKKNLDTLKTFQQMKKEFQTQNNHAQYIRMYAPPLSINQSLQQNKTTQNQFNNSVKQSLNLTPKYQTQEIELEDLIIDQQNNQNQLPIENGIT